MGAVSIAGIMFACTFTGALLGMLMRSFLPGHHLDSDTRDVVKLVLALIATMSALVLSLLIASAKGSYDTQAKEIEHLATNIVRLDRTLAHYGSETDRARALLRESVVDGIERIWPSKPNAVAAIRPSTDFAHTEAFYVVIQNLKPQSDVQRLFQSQALVLGAELSETRLKMYIESTRSISRPLMMVLGFWLTTLFTGFGLFARPHATVVGAFFVGALAVGGAIFLVVDLEDPFVGIMRVPPLALTEALAQMQPAR